MRTSQKRSTDACRNGKSVHVRGTLRCERLGCYELVADAGKGTLNYDDRFTVPFYAFK